VYGNVSAGNESDAGMELAQFEMERAVAEKFPDDICAFCGSDQEIKQIIVNSQRLSISVELPVCKICSFLMTEMVVEDYFRTVQDSNPFLWSLIVIHNMRKINWISRSVFDVLKERREESISIAT
jgi:hypothetical protein